VWKHISDFSVIPTLPPTTITKGDTKTVGSIREFSVGEAKIAEELTAYFDKGPHYSLTYIFTSPNFGVTEYASTWTVVPTQFGTTRFDIVCSWVGADSMGPFCVGLMNSVMDTIKPEEKK
jgi:hypothetical protein